MVHCCGMWTAVDDDFSQRLTHRAAVLEGDALQRVRLLDDVPDEGLIVPEAVAAGAPVALEGAPESRIDCFSLNMNSESSMSGTIS